VHTILDIKEYHKKNINYILEFHLIAQDVRLNWLFDIVSESCWLSGHEFESHHPHSIQ